MPFTPATTRNNLGPLTTTFAPAPTCTFYGIIGQNAGGFQAQGCSDGFLMDTAMCWLAATVPAPAGPLIGWGFYSPGMICPTGYTSACTAYGASASAPDAAYTTLGTSFSFNFPLLPSETAVGCCPSGFDCNHGAGSVQTCLQHASATSFYVGTCDGDALAGFAYRTVPETLTPTGSSVFTTSTVNLWAPLFQLNMQPSDFGLAVAPTLGSAPAGASNTSDSGNAAASGLPSGTIAAIVVPIVVVVAALLAGTFWLWRRKRRRQSVDRPHEPPPRLPKSELANFFVPAGGVKQELRGVSDAPDEYGGRKKELPGSTGAVEAPGTEKRPLAGSGRLHELPGSHGMQSGSR